MIFTEKYIKSLFLPDIYKRGKDYYKEGRVLEVIDHGDRITSKVKGSENNVYEVLIYKDNKNLMQCSCPYESKCKHLVATLLYYIERVADKGELQNPLKNKNNEIKEIVLDINKEKEKKVTDSFLNDFETEKDISFLKTFLNKKDNAFTPNLNEKWKVVFLLANKEKYLNSYASWEDHSSSLYISLGLQYIKKDGTLSRFMLFNPKKNIAQPENEKEKKLYNILYYKPGFTMVADSYFEFLLNNKDLPLYVKEFNKYYPATFHEIEKTEIDFKITDVYYREKKIEITFKPHFIFYGKDGKFATFSYSYHNDKYLVFLDYFLVLTEDGNIFYKKNDNILYIEFITYILNSKNYSYKDISKIFNIWEKHLTKDIVWKFNKNKIKIIEKKPDPILEIEKSMLSSENITLYLVFNYDGNEIWYGKYNDFLIKENDSEEIIVYKRDKNFEKEVALFLSKYLTENYDSYVYVSSYSDCFEICMNLSLFLSEIGIKLLDEGYEIRFRNKKDKIFQKAGRVNIDVKSGIDWFDISSNYLFDSGEIASFKLTKEIVRNGLIEINNNFIILSKEDIEKLNLLLENGANEDGKLKISKQHFDLIESLYLSVSNKELEDFAFAVKIAKKLKNFKSIEEKALPERFNGVLREYQKAGYNWLHFLKKYNLNGCLADDMGLGKTVQTLTFLQKLKEENDLKLSLLIVPVTTVANWENEIQKFTPDLKYYRHHGQKRVKDKDFFSNYDLIISSYHTIRNDIKLFKDFEFDYIILDESQNIKNYKTQIFKTVKILKANHKLTLTGTPIENNTSELWSQFNFLNPSLLGSISDFRNNFIIPIECYKNKDVSLKLRKIIYPFILRRKKEEVAKDLPDKEEILLYCEMNDSQKKVYNKLKDFYKYQIKEAIEINGIEKSTIKILEALLRLRQVALFPSLASDDFANIPSIKLETLKELIEEILKEEHKILIFSQFVRSLKIIEENIKHKKIKYSYIDGQTKNRDKEIEKFQEEKDVQVFLLSLKAGGVGINLTSADYVVIFDPWWNPAVENQAIDRAHRIGQTKKVIVYKLIVKDTVEEKIIELQNKKKELVKELITEEATFFKSLSKDDILNLF